MGTHPIFESDFDCLTEMEESENDTTVRYFQWVDDYEGYTAQSILSRVKYNSKRFIRWPDGDMAVIPEERLRNLPDFQKVKVKWFQRIGGAIHRFDAKIRPHVNARCIDNFRVLMINNLERQGFDKKSSTMRRILQKYDKNPAEFQRAVARDIETEFSESSEQVRDEDIEKLEAEIKKLEDSYKIIEGATSQLIEAVRVKYVEDFQCEKENQQHKPIIFATQPT